MNEEKNEKKKELIMPISIVCEFQSLEQRIVFEAVIMPEIRAILNMYAPLLGYVGISEDLEKFESEEK
nr:MAG TPA: hypothetical protein [Inoviridae sp.]